MSFTYPTVKQLSEQILADLKGSIQDHRYFLPGSPLHALSHALSGAAYMLHAHIENVGNHQLLPDSAIGEALIRWARIVGLEKRSNETDVELRERILLRLRNPSRGGTVSDYISWSQELEFVGRVWVYEWNTGPGSVGVAFLGRDYKLPLPNEADVEALKQHLLPKKPCAVTLNVFSLKPLEIRVAIKMAGEAYREAITDSLKKLFFNEAHPGKTMTRSRIEQMISQVVQGRHFELIAPEIDILLGSKDVGLLKEILWL